MPTELPPLRLDIQGHLAIIVLDRPATLNAIDVSLAGLLGETIDRIASDTTIRAVLLRGEGRGFCAGGDVARFDGSEPFADIAARTMARFHPAVLALSRLPIPTVAAVHGVVAGAGIGLMLACDLAVAAEGTRFTLAYSKIGGTLDGGASWMLPRILGARKAKELALLSETFDAASAHALGLVNRLVPDDRLLDDATQLATKLADGPTGAYATIKRLIDRSEGSSLADQLDAERDGFVEAAGTEDFAEGLGAFRARRAPVFGGR